MRRLRADHLDIVYLCDQIARQEQSLDELVGLRERGVVHHIGLVVTDADESQSLIESGQFDVAELHRDVSDTNAVSSLLDACDKHGMGVCINKPLSSETLKDLLSDARIHLINLGMRWEHEVATNSRLFADLEPCHTVQ